MTALIACVIALSQIPENGYQTIWTSEPLSYQQPKVPEFFLDPAHPKPIKLNAWMMSDLVYEFKDGRELYLTSHRGGWEMCRGWFYGSTSEGLPIPPPVVSETKDPSDYKAWDVDHLAFGRENGYVNCRNQLAVLLEKSSANELRGELAYSVYWQKIPIWILALVAAWFAGINRLIPSFEKRIRLRQTRERLKRAETNSFDHKKSGT